MSNNNKASASGKPQWLQFFLISYLLILGYMWFTGPSEEERARQAAEHAAQQTTSTLVAQSPNDQVTSAPVRTVDPQSSVTVQTHPGALIPLKTDNFKVELDSVGGVVHSWEMLDIGSQSYDPAEHTTGIEMVQRIPGLNTEFAAQQNWPLEIYLKEQGARSYEDFNHIEWTSESIETSGQAAVRMQSPPIRGLRVEKTLELPDDSFYGTLRVTVHNETSSSLRIFDELNRGLTVRWGPGLLARDLYDTNQSADHYDAAVARDQDEVHVFRPEVGGEVLEMNGPLMWAGVESKFFAALLVPQQPEDASVKNTYYFRTLVPGSYKINANEAASPSKRAALDKYKAPLVMELSTAKFEMEPGSSKTFEFGVYVGPKKHSVLKEYGHKLQTLIYSESWWWMRAIYLLMTDVLNGIHRFIIGNYGLAIMLLTVIVKLLVFPLVHRAIKIQAKSSAEMKRIKPHLEAINEKYKDDAQEKQRQTWKTYQEHGVNPLSGMRSCLPVLPQMPVFIALYRIANDTIDLQGAHFLWIKDLSQADHLVHFGTSIPFIGSYFNILPIVVAFTQMLSSKISMSRSMQNITDPNQQQMQKMMVYVIPVVVMVTMYNFPAGLMLYWLTSNTWQIGQTLITNRILDREEEKHLKAGPPPRKVKKRNPNSFMSKMMARAEEARKEMEKREQMAKKSGGKQGRKK